MKKIFASLVVGAAILSAAPAAAQSSATASAAGSATILRPITLTNTSGLVFGRVVKPSTGTGTVSISNASDAVTAGSGAVALSGITTSRAKFTIAGEGGALVSLTIPSSFNLTDGTTTLGVTLTSNLSGSTTLSGTAGSEGTASLNIGGSFNLPSDATTGSGYAGSFNVTTAYN